MHEECSEETKCEKPAQRLRPDSWTEEEANSYEGRHVRFRNVNFGAGLVRSAVGFVDREGLVFLYALRIALDSGEEIHLSKVDMLAGDWAFDVV